MQNNQNANENKNDFIFNDSHSNYENISENNILDKNPQFNNINFNKINKKNENNNVFEDLKEIRNKQRSKPVILDLNSL